MSSELVIVERASREPVIPGDFVHLASGSPLGLVQVVENEDAEVTWFCDQPIRRRLPSVCLRPLPHG